MNGARSCRLGLLLILAAIPACGSRNEAGLFRSPAIAVPSVDAELPIIPDGVVSRAITWENRTGEPGAGGKEQGVFEE